MFRSKYIKIALFAVVAIVGGVNVFNAQKSESLSDVALANVEALAQGEVDIPYICAGSQKLCYDTYYKEFFDGIKIQ